MSNLDKNIMSSVRFKINPCIEFGCAIGAIGNYEVMIKLAEELNFTLDKYDEEIFNKLYSNLSTYVKNEFKYFFSMSNINALIFAFAVDNEAKEIDTVLKLLGEADEVTLFNYIGGVFIGEQLKGDTTAWCEVKDDMSKMLSFIENINVEDKEKKSKVIECFKNPEETKQRLHFIFKQFYEKSYKSIEKEVLKQLELQEEKYKLSFNNNPQEFMKKYFIDFFKPEKNNWPYKISIHVSLFQQIGFSILNLHDYKEKEGLAAFGIRNFEYYFVKEKKEQVDKFLKALSDVRRVNIIKMLAQKPCYGYEIAANLNISPATINYHMTFLTGVDIVTFERDENKVYYSLKKERVKELMKESEKFLLNE